MTEKETMERKEYLGHSFQGDGAALQKLFDPRFVLPELYTENSLQGISVDYLPSLVGEVRKHIAKSCQEGYCSGEVLNRQGQYEIYGDAAEVMRKTGGAIASLLAAPEVVQLPQSKPEKQQIGKTFAHSLMHYHAELDVVAPVCPDYGRGENFYRSIGRGISPEARGAIEAAKVLTSSFSEFITPYIRIVVADTEDDIDEVMQNTAAGEISIFKEHCEASVQAIASEVQGLPHVSVSTFSQMFGSSFRELQKTGEEKIREIMETDEKFRAHVTGIANARAARHAQILARPEQAHELTIRYMAQYMSLGEHMRFREEPHMLLNYPTPNRAFYNAVTNIHPELRLPPTSGKEVIPVIGTFAKR